MPREVGRDGALGLEVVDPDLVVEQAGVDRRALREGPEVVAAGREERRHGDLVGGGRVDGLAVHAQRRDPVALGAGRVERVRDVARGAELQVRARRHGTGRVALPLLLEDLLQLGAREAHRAEVVGEGQHGVGLGEGDDAVGVRAAGALEEQLVAQATGVDDREVGTGGRVLDAGQLGVGDEVAERRLARPVVAVAARVGGGDVGADLRHRLLADLLGLGQRGVDDGLDLGDAREAAHERRVVGGGALDVGGGARDGTGVTVDRQVDAADGLAVAAGLQHRSGLARLAGDGRLPGVLLVGVAREDRVDLRVGLGDDVGEGAAGGHLLLERGAVGRARTSALVVGGDDDVGRRGRRLELVDRAVDRLDRVRELQVGDARGRDQRRRLLGDGADDGDVEAADLEGLVRRERRLAGRLGHHVGTEVGEVGPVAHAPGEVGEAAVELVVADRRDAQAQGVQHVDGRLVLLHRGGEQRGADVVARREEQGVGLPRLGPQLLDRAGHLDGVRVDAAVEVVDVEQPDGDVVRRLGGGRGEDAGPEGQDEGGCERGSAQTCLHVGAVLRVVESAPRWRDDARTALDRPRFHPGPVRVVNAPRVTNG